jgi:hypothetical protein
LRCREEGCRERKKDIVRGGEGKKKRVRDRERRGGVESERVRVWGVYAIVTSLSGTLRKLIL